MKPSRLPVIPRRQSLEHGFCATEKELVLLQSQHFP
jgi:hypothetical protein